MTRRRLQESRSADAERLFYASRYPAGYQHYIWPDHVVRIAESRRFLAPWMTSVETVADLSCGDGALALGLGAPRTYLGDLNEVPPGEEPGVVRLAPGALPESLRVLSDMVDLYLCSETLEHVHDPEQLLRQIRRFAKSVFISTPVDEPLDYGNLEHYWSWGVTDIEELLLDTGWNPRDHRVIKPGSGWYTFQFWYAR